MRRCSAGAQEEKLLRSLTGREMEPVKGERKTNKAKNRRKTGLISVSAKMKGNVWGPQTARRTKQGFSDLLRRSDVEDRIGAPISQCPAFALPAAFPAAVSRAAALFGCSLVPDMFYLAGCRPLDGRLRLLLHCFAANVRNRLFQECLSKFMPPKCRCGIHAEGFQL